MRQIVLITALLLGSYQLFAQNQMALTFDDLPVGKSGGYTITQMHSITDSILHTLTVDSIPAIGFVNEERLYKTGEIDSRVAIIQKWLDAGLEIGNHTFSHPSLYNTPLEDFKEDFLRGETVIRKLLSKAGKELRYFRHPFLNTGPTPEVRDAFHEWLAERGYTIAFVTVDNSEWIFNAAYDRAKGLDNKKKVGEAYVTYMEKQTAFSEYISEKLLGYNVKHTMLLHANRINAHYLNELVAIWKKMGYEFISIDEAQQDKAYEMEDNYTGRAGVTWLFRWAYGTEKQKEIDWKTEPEVPEFVMQLYQMRR